MWLIIILITIISLILTHWFYNEYFGYWRKRGVPHPRTLPLIGNLGATLNMVDFFSNQFNKVYKDYKDCLYVGFYQFQTPTILIRDLELVKTVATKEFSSFHDNQFLINKESDPIFGKNPFVTKGQPWKNSRAQVMSGVTKEKVKIMVNFMWIVGKHLVQLLNEEIKSNKPIDGKELSARYTTDVTASCLFGFEGNALNDKNSAFRQVTRKLFEPSISSKLKFLIIIAKPYLGYMMKFSFISKSAKKLFVDFFQDFIKYRELNNIVRNDFIDQMISYRTKLSENEFKHEDMLSRILTLVIGTSETSSIALNSILYEIANNSEVQMKLHKEIDTAMEKCNGEMTYEELENMNYLDMVILEAMRKNPPNMFMNRMCTKEFTLPPVKGEGTGPNVTVEIGTPTLIPIYAIHMDPNYYPEPEKFIPERFSDEAKLLRPKYSYLPFGEGPRICLGFRLAVAQIKVAIISILANFNIRLNPKTTPTFDINVETIFFSKRGGIWLDFDKRTC